MTFEDLAVFNITSDYKVHGIPDARYVWIVDTRSNERLKVFISKRVSAKVGTCISPYYHVMMGKEGKFFIGVKPNNM